MAMSNEDYLNTMDDLFAWLDEPIEEQEMTQVPTLLIDHIVHTIEDKFEESRVLTKAFRSILVDMPVDLTASDLDVIAPIRNAFYLAISDACTEAVRDKGIATPEHINAILNVVGAFVGDE